MGVLMIFWSCFLKTWDTDIFFNQLSEVCFLLLEYSSKQKGNDGKDELKVKQQVLINVEVGWGILFFYFCICLKIT